MISISMVYISYSPETLKQMVKMMIFFYLVSFAFGGANVQKKLLEAEGVKVVDGKVDLNKYML